MPVFSLEAIILQAFAYGDTSRILRLLTPSHGIQSVIAKGARRPRSQYGGLLEPFSRGTATVHIRESRELQTMSAFDLTRSGQSLGRDLMRFGGASLIAEIVLRTTREEPQPGLFALVAEALDRIDDADAEVVESVVLARAWGLIACLGFAPDLETCVYCGRPAEPGENKIDYAAGGIRCNDCSRDAPGRILPGHALEALRTMISGGTVALDETRGHWWLLARYLDHHLLEGSTLQSLAFIDTARGEGACAS